MRKPIDPVERQSDCASVAEGGTQWNTSADFYIHVSVPRKKPSQEARN